MGDMANNSVAYSGVKNSLKEANHDGDFGITLAELRALMELRSTDALRKIQESYGDVYGICTKLKTSPNEGEFYYACFWFFVQRVLYIWLINEHAYIILAIV
ncbi:ATPase plasma membrane Ca2+ transporting 1 [Homo sapiens]|uniref:ATPase plasma membrane Ca2+ transporting 1 n=1 Tax=Homo sapiens TaxID=9606 RepID=F8W1V5_HUMAN|nr:ATPase plasma membrane Ca2+ transporting 1 [Homo sapiens]KAI4067536.1 ATPase plasma membrane Ca2+ transporting 1 [Homo sapiens]